MIKFKLIQDWYVDDFFDKVKMYDAGHIFIQTENGKYIIDNPINGSKITMDTDQMRNAKNGQSLMFEEIHEQEINIKINEVSSEEDLEIKNWRIQLDVKTSLRNLKKIEKFIKENIHELL